MLQAPCSFLYVTFCVIKKKKKLKLNSLQKSEIWCKSSIGRAEVLDYSGETWAGGAHDGIRKFYTGFSAGENVPWKDTNESDRKKKKDNELLGLLKGKSN